MTFTREEPVTGPRWTESGVRVQEDPRAVLDEVDRTERARAREALERLKKWFEQEEASP